MQSPVNPNYTGFNPGMTPVGQSPYHGGYGPMPQQGQPLGYPTSPQGQMPTNYPMTQQGQMPPGYPMTQQTQMPAGYPMTQQGQIPPGYPMTQTQAPGYLGNQAGQQMQNPQGYQAGTQTTNEIIGQLQPLPGYEGISFDPLPSAPPPFEFPADHQPNQPIQFNESVSTLTIEDVREALIEYSKSNCCFGSSAARNMTLKDINYRSTFHYKLESFTEKRETFWEFEPLGIGNPVSCNIGTPLGPWQMQVPDPPLFLAGSTALEVPNTSCVKPCHSCMALGQKLCKTCIGSGHKHCKWCNGKGTRFTDDTCDHCNGSGRERCTDCHGNGHMPCDICKQKQQLRFFVRLRVTWTVHKDDFISDSTSIPFEQIKKVTGQVAFNDEGFRVYPATNFPDIRVGKASLELVTKHQNTYTQEKILKQRQSVEIIPIAEVNSNWKEQDRTFSVYGFENEVYFPDYPQKCCCGCSLL